MTMPFGVATVLGSLPFRTVAETSRFMLDLVPRLVAVPLVSVMSAPARAIADEAGEPDPLVAFRAFLATLSGRVEPIVLSVTGPVTVLMDLRRDGLGGIGASETATDLVESRAHAMLDAASELVPGAPVLLVLDEPALANSMHPTFPIDSDEISAMVAEVVTDVGDAATVGVKVDGRADWAMLLKSGIGLLGAPVSAHLETAGAEVAAFLERGGLIAWGAVPTNEPLGTNADRLWRRLNALWCDLIRAGTDPQLLRERSIITTAGELGSFGVSQAERAIALAQDLASRVVRQAFGMHLSIGA